MGLMVVFWIAVFALLIVVLGQKRKISIAFAAVFVIGAFLVWTKLDTYRTAPTQMTTPLVFEQDNVVNTNNVQEEGIINNFQKTAKSITEEDFLLPPAEYSQRLGINLGPSSGTAYVTTQDWIESTLILNDNVHFYLVPTRKVAQDDILITWVPSNTPKEYTPAQLTKSGIWGYHIWGVGENLNRIKTYFKLKNAQSRELTLKWYHVNGIDVNFSPPDNLGLVKIGEMMGTSEFQISPVILQNKERYCFIPDRQLTNEDALMVWTPGNDEVRVSYTDLPNGKRGFDIIGNGLNSKLLPLQVKMLSDKAVNFSIYHVNN